MKTAKCKIPVYGRDRNILIGALECGERALVLGEEQDDIIIAYILGRIKSEDAAGLVEEEDWDKQTSGRDKFLAYIDSRQGCLYVWGAQGQAMTQSLIKRLENSEKNYKRALAQYEKHMKNGQTLVAYDCSGLIVAYLLEKGMIEKDTTANGLYFHHCTPISKNDLIKGDLVFKKYSTKNKMHHVGVYMGDGSVVHAKGRDYGVIRESICKTGWNRYGRLNVLGQESGQIPAYTRKLKKTSPYIIGDDVRAVQKALVKNGFDPGVIDGIYGKKTQAAVKAYQKANGLEIDGIVGPVTWARLF